jgi:uncharacterized BrkB/YihY/UPF0761 family membrane protein
VDVWRSSREHRTTGHAAEMAFFAVLTLVPSTVAVGAALGLSKHVIGESTVTQAEDAAIDAVRAMMGPDLADTVISPFVHAQLAQVTIIGQSVNAVVATVLWAYLASIAILVGGEFNAALRAVARRRRGS